MRSRRNSIPLEAWNASYLRTLSDDIRDELLSDALVITLPPRSLIHADHTAPRYAVIHSGQARVQIRASDGRSATVRYVRPGQVIGLPALLANATPVSAVTVTECAVVYLSVAKVQRYMATRPDVSNLFLRESSILLYEAIEFLAENVFGTVQQRVCRHLLDLAISTPEGLVVEVDQTTVAEGIGTVREVAARAIRLLRDDGLLERHGKCLLILDREALENRSQSILGA